MAIVDLCPRCGAPCPSGKRLCEQHTRKDKRPSAHARGYDAQHRKDRRRYLRAHPVCEEPGCTQRSTVLDHIDNLGPLGPSGHDQSNWMALCASCHGRKTAAETPGGWNRG